MSTAVDTRSKSARSEREPAEVIPPLENGDRLSREEFYRRWEAMPNLKHAERIEGIVYMQAAVRHVQHGSPHSKLDTWLGVYSASTPGTDSGIESSVRIDSDNDPQPDVVLRVLPEFGGRCPTNPAGFLEGTPELVAEVAASSVSLDLNHKLDVYRRNGVEEYVVWKVLEGRILWFHLVDGGFVADEPDEHGLLHSVVFPGLRLNVSAMLAADMKCVLADLNTGLATPEHAAFVERLAAAKAK